MGELRQHHPSLKISRVKALAKGDLLVVGGCPQDAVILQTESKMKAALGKNVRVSFPKAYQTTQTKKKCLAVKGFPTDRTANEFKEVLDLNKITYAKAERLKSKKDGRVLSIFQLEISDPAEAEALLSQNLVCNVTGIVYKVEEFRQPVSVRQCFNCQCFGHSAQNLQIKTKMCHLWWEPFAQRMPKKRSKTAQMCKLFWATCSILQGVSWIQKAGFQATCG